MLRKDYIAFIRTNAPHITGVHQMRKEKLATIYEELVKQQNEKKQEEEEKKQEEDKKQRQKCMEIWNNINHEQRMNVIQYSQKQYRKYN